MATTSPRVRALLRQAQRTAGRGKRAAAHQLYRQILDEEPRTVEAWIGLAQVSQDPDERKTALQRALVLDPENATARALLNDGQAPDRDAGPPPGEEQADDPFSQSRVWLDEATARKPQDGRDGQVKTEPIRAPAPQTPALPVIRPRDDEMPDVSQLEAEEPVLYCYRHPQRETSLRCITCNRPICTHCAQHTPVGYRCPQCIREAQDVFFSANVLDYLVTGLITLILAIIAGVIAPNLGFFVIFIGPAAGTLIGRIAFRVARRRHGRYLPQLVAGLVAIGGLLPVGLILLGGSGSLFGLIWPLVYVFLATGAAYYQVK